MENHGKYESDEDNDNFFTNKNAFPKFDAILKDYIEHGSCHTKMLPWNVENDIISCLAEFVRDPIKEHISESMYSSVPNKRHPPLFKFLKLFPTLALSQMLIRTPVYFICYSKYFFTHLYRYQCKHSNIEISVTKYQKNVKNL